MNNKGIKVAILEEANAEVITTDVLILGGGIAACHAAIRAKEHGLDVVLVDKASIGRSGNSPMMSGVLTYFDPESDDYGEWYRECIDAGEGLVDERNLDGMINESHHRIREMVSWGVRFQQEDEEYIRKPCVGHIHARNVLMTNSGFQMMSVIRGEVIRRGVKIIERVMAIDLLTSDGETPTGGAVVGALGINVRTGKFYVFIAKATVLTTGNTCSVHLGSSAPVLSGDGQGMAFRVGCEMRNYELCMYSPHPAGLNCAPGLNIFTTEGAYFVNAKGDRFMPQWDPQRMDRAPRVVTSRAIITEEYEGRGPVYLDATHLTDDSYRRIEQCAPIVLASVAAIGLNIRKDKIPYTASLGDIGPGGIRINKDGATTIPGLYAGGSVSDHAEQGVANVISQGMMSLIEGWRAGEGAAKYAAGLAQPAIRERQMQHLKDRTLAPMKRQSGTQHEMLRKYARNMLRNGLLGPVKNENNLRKAVEEVRDLREKQTSKLAARDYHELARCIGIQNELLFLEMYAVCSLLRTESRGMHWRKDYPQRDDTNWLKWVIAKRDGDDIRVWAETIPEGK